ncbi:hypothetical protein XENORESO_009541, partial [Xenotaenia resolanae]
MVPKLLLIIPYAHQQCRKAERLVAAGKYEEAISCHGKAAGNKLLLRLPSCIAALMSPPEVINSSGSQRFSLFQ